jgi:hypothetical protein
MPKDSLPVSIEYRNALRLQFNTKLIRHPLTPPLHIQGQLGPAHSKAFS